jgi:hypothetical protein
MLTKPKILCNNPQLFSHLKNSSFIICLHFGTTSPLWLNIKSLIASAGGNLCIGGKHIFRHKKRKFIACEIQGSFCIFFAPTKTEQWNFIVSFIEKNKHFHILGGRRKNVPFFTSKKITETKSEDRLLHTIQKSHDILLSLLFPTLMK